MTKVQEKAAWLMATTLAVVAGVAPIGNIVAHFNVSKDVATTIVALITSGSIALDFLFPFIIPVVGTVEALIAAFGAGVAIGW